jgi:hypothetical protein
MARYQRDECCSLCSTGRCHLTACRPVEIKLTLPNFCHMVAIYHAYYNFYRVHQTPRVTPPMEAGLTDHVWSLEEIVMMAEHYAPKLGKRGPYKKRA